MARLIRVLIAAVVVTLIVAPAAHARAGSLQTVTIRAPVPAAGDFSIVTFEMRIGGEGSHHHKQPVQLELRNHHEPRVFALARLRPEPHHPGRFIGVLEVFHRAAAKTAAQSSSSGGPPLAQAGGGYSGDELVVRAIGEQIVKETIKDDIEELGERYNLEPDEFCDPENEEEYELGSWIIDQAVIAAGAVSDLPSKTTIRDLANDAVDELCHKYYARVPIYPGLLTLRRYLGYKMTTSPTSSLTSPVFPSYAIGFSGQWMFVEPNELRLAASFSWSVSNPALDTIYPVTAIKIVVPPLSTSSGTTPRLVTNFICPSQLPSGAIVSTRYPNDTLMCSGGTLPINQQFMLNLQSLPPPNAGMGGMMLAQQNGAYVNPFTIGGP